MKTTAKSLDTFRRQVGQYIIGIRAEGMKKAQVRQVIAVIGYRLFDDIIAAVQDRRGDPAYSKDFALVTSEKGTAVHFMGAAVMMGSREETVMLPDPSKPGESREVKDPGYIHPWSYRIDHFATHKRGAQIKRIKPTFGKITLCPEEHRDTNLKESDHDWHAEKPISTST